MVARLIRFFELFSFSIILFNTNYTIIVLILQIWQHRFILNRYRRKSVIFYMNLFVIYSGSSSSSNTGALWFHKGSVTLSRYRSDERGHARSLAQPLDGGDCAI